MLTMLLKFVLLTLSLQATMSEPTEIVLEVETSRGSLRKHTRSAASGRGTSWLKEGDSVSIPFCLERLKLVRVAYVAYTNDGESDIVQVKIGNKEMGTFTSRAQSAGGYLWNVVETSKVYGSSISQEELRTQSSDVYEVFGSGIHQLNVEVLSSDIYGIELDMAVLKVDDPPLGEYFAKFSCEIRSLPDALILPSPAPGSDDDDDDIYMILEVETSRGSLLRQARSAASGKQTVYFQESNSVSIPFCLMRPTSVRVASVAYTNDGDSDTVEVKIGNKKIGTFTSRAQSGGGNLWNLVEYSGPIGSSNVYGSGIHRLKLEVLSSDIHGVELDKVLLKVDDQFLGKTSRTFSCELPCLQDIPALLSRATESVDDGYLQQKSYMTMCAEEDNVYIPVFHPTACEYTIAATPPLYHSFENHRYDNKANCMFFPPEYWKFKDVKVDHLLQSLVLISNDATFGPSTPIFNTLSKPLEFSVVFRLKGRSVGLIDADIGSKLDLTLSGLTSDANVTLLYKGRANTSVEEQTMVFTTPSHSHSWDISDFTWVEHGDNEVVFKITTSQTSGIVVDTLQMERRYMSPDQEFDIFKNDDIRIEGLDVDFWWRAPETMQVTLSTTGQTWDNVDYMRISVPVPWNTTWCQVFVLYQDGNVRLLPMPIVGTDWIPFGTSVIIGQTNSDDHRPTAPISHVSIDPTDLTMKLVYMDGGQAHLELSHLVEKTQVLVHDLQFFKDTNSHPFVTLRSMFVDAGNSDADSVMTDTVGPNHVMADWGTMTGKSFLLYRTCQSDHLTQSPDIRLDILRTDCGEH